MSRQFPGTAEEWIGALIVAAFVAAAVLIGAVIDRLRQRRRGRSRRWWE